MQSLPPASNCLVLGIVPWLEHRKVPGDAFYRAPEAECGTEHSPTAGSVPGLGSQGDCHFMESIGGAQIKELQRSSLTGKP